MNTEGNATRPKVLVIEDEPLCQLLVRAYLRNFPVDVVVCGDAESGIEALEEYCPDLILMDVLLPRMDGIEATEEIRRRAAFRRTPIAMTTTMDHQATSVDAREAGADTYLVKPLRFGDLRDLLSRFLGVGEGAAAPQPV